MKYFFLEKKLRITFTYSSAILSLNNTWGSVSLRALWIVVYNQNAFHKLCDNCTLDNRFTSWSDQPSYSIRSALSRAWCYRVDGVGERWLCVAFTIPFVRFTLPTSAECFMFYDWSIIIVNVITMGHLFPHAHSYCPDRRGERTCQSLVPIN